ncbi:type II toxin-antitoxin system HicA family toxin [soil metagenome]|jgi:hypothetical protein
MGSRHWRTIDSIFEDPVRANIIWREVEQMLEHFGATISERSGSAIAIELNERTAFFHRPHPQKEAKRYQIRALREFLILTGMTPR